MPLFGAEGLRQLERVNEEIARNGRAGQKHQPALPLFTTSDLGAVTYPVRESMAGLGRVCLHDEDATWGATSIAEPLANPSVAPRTGDKGSGKVRALRRRRGARRRGGVQRRRYGVRHRDWMIERRGEMGNSHARKGQA